ncbi:unnamed protein product [Phytomonas sp. EM1]|nr:unnamed protein product [Phytomonas sp. EM1]|eukprot:CCW59618.1 unnamed protein product [Phytomonas sp. isolate EM1]
MDADAARVKSTSVNAGRPILQATPSVGMGDYYASSMDRVREPTAFGSLPAPQGSSDGGTPHPEEARRLSGEAQERRDTIFSPQHDFVSLSDASGISSPGSSTVSELPFEKQLELDVKRLEYYQGTSKFPELLKEFREKYQRYDPNQSEAKSRSAEDGSGHETKEPVDYQHLSAKLKAQLSAGPHAYHPISLMEHHGLVRFQGYAFPPSVELGNLKDGHDIARLQGSYRKKGALALLRRSFNALVGRPDRSDEYLATDGNAKEDTHIIYRTLGLDAVQRRQMRFMLSDFDHSDRNTSFHVMMSYPYADWLHVFFMVFVGCCLYQLQVRLDAYDFYDEYLGLDLRQVPSLKKPFLVVVTAVVMVFFLFQPLLVASIATNRTYRIAMRRPIGPP